MLISRFCILSMLLYTITSVSGEIKVFSGTLEATSTSVRYITSYLVDPGSVDLTHVTFTADESSALFVTDDDRYGSTTFDDGEDFDGITDDITDKEDHEYNTILDTDSPTIAPTVASTSSSIENGTGSPTSALTVVSTSASTEKETEEATSEETTKAPKIKPPKAPTEAQKKKNDDGLDDGFWNDDGANDDGRHERGLAEKEFTIDLLFFLEPTDCAKTKEGCDWNDLGIGNSDKLGNTRWCCSEDAISLGLCSVNQAGRMIVQPEIYKGEHRFVNIPAKGEFIGTVPYPVMTTHSGSGQYTLLMANCNDYGRDVQLDGSSVWKSSGGYLPGDLFDEWHFVIFMTLCYVGLLVWYGYNMKKNKESTIGIQKWIIGTIILGVFETSIESIDYMQWNYSGVRSNGTMYTWIIIGVLKGSISRCLLIMVSLGWGVIRDTLGDQMKKIIMLGLFYLVVAFLRDIAGIVFVKEIHVLSDSKEEAIYDLFTFFTLITATVDVVCYMWILDALNGTMQYLENMNQTMKLKRYLRLRLILLLSILFGLFWAVMGIVNTTMDTAILAENQDWIIPSAGSANFFFILTSIALLWRPNPGAKDFAFVMELPAVGGDLGFETSIDDDDDDENGTEMRVRNGVVS